ncbi:MAG: class I SAM-dependent methyltransferase [Leptospiraceae bacterium]|nr:class I SAM-dependent methyltransferase [Leptospiraceae bacterium]
MDIHGREIIDCPLNKDCNWQFLYKSEFNSYDLPIHKCNTCKLQAIHPREKINFKEMYSEKYYTGKSEYSYKDERRTEKYDSYVWDARIKNIKKFIKNGNFLDVGCSFGGLLSRAKQAGFNPYGVEVSEFSSEFTRKKGIPVFTGNFIDCEYEENFFDVITMIEVIEHLENPSKVFDKLYSLVKPGGLVVIQTANFDGLQAKEEGKNYHYYLPGHLYYYSDSNLTNFLKERGFSKFNVYYGVDFPLYAKLLKSRGSFDSIKDYWKWVRIAKYHMKSKLYPKSTSSMVLYAFK